MNRMAFTVSLLFVASPFSTALAQEKTSTDSDRPTVSDTPGTVDPAVLVPKFLVEPVTLDFSDSSLLELATALRDTLQTPVLFDRAALQTAGIPLGEPFSDHLTDAPVYLLLNRLKSLGLTWYVEDNVIQITTTEVGQRQRRTNSYPVGDLVDAGFESTTLRTALAEILLFGQDKKNASSMHLLGDVLFARHDDQTHRELKGLLSALRDHGRQTFISDPPEHQPLREKLNVNLSTDFNNIPLTAAVKQLASMTELDLRVDVAALREAKIREREPVSLTLSKRRLRTVLNAMLSPLKLTWTLRDGVVWVTTPKRQQSERVIAVYDVRDLCGSSKETSALMDAIPAQTSGVWESFNKNVGNGRIVSPRSGCVIVRQTQNTHREILLLLQAYRVALANSKQRVTDDPEQEVVTRFYRLQTPLAESLQEHLTTLVSGWDDKATMVLIPAGRGASSQYNENEGESLMVESDFSILVVSQKRHVQRELNEVITRMTTEDYLIESDEDFIGVGGGGFGGGFGGGGKGEGAGLFSIPNETP